MTDRKLRLPERRPAYRWSDTSRAQAALSRLSDLFARREQSTIAPTRQSVFISRMLGVISVFLLLLVLNTTVVSQLQHYTSQQALYESFRVQLAEGSIPIGQTDSRHMLVVPGAPIALLEIPALNIGEVVVEGSASAQTMTGVGHRADTPLPGQPGTAELMGRAAAYGGVFSRLASLTPGDSIYVTTGQGISTYRVSASRTGDATATPLGVGKGRLTLTTATGVPFAPTGVLRVDADLVTTAFQRPAPVVAEGVFAPSSVALASDDSGNFALSWLLELLVAAAIVVTWAAKRWPRRVTWLIFVPVLTCVGLAVAAHICLLLPNLL